MLVVATRHLVGNCDIQNRQRNLDFGYPGWNAGAYVVQTKFDRYTEYKTQLVYQNTTWV